MRLPRPKIATKFFLPLLVSVPLVAVLSVVGVQSLAAMRRHADQLYSSNTRTLVATTDLGKELGFAEARALALLVATRAPDRIALARQIEVGIAPVISHDLAVLQTLQAGDPGASLPLVARLRRQLVSLNALYDVVRRYGAATTTVPRARAAVVARQITRSMGPLLRITDRLEAEEVAEARAAHTDSSGLYVRGRAWIVVIGLLSLLGGIGAALLLTGSIAPRVRAYSAFASRVAAGDMSERVTPGGNDELTDLGHALNDMVDRRAEADARDRAQDEFAETMQVARTEGEANDLIKRHLERTVAGSSVVVLSVDHEGDRLRARTAIPEDSELAAALATAQPRSCLGIRLGRRHRGGGEAEPLVTCDVCGGESGRRSTCRPLVVGGEVIGSVLVDHPEGLSAAEEDAVRDSTSQAAPVLANLHNLAVAERRASTDSLTKLPNNRAIRDTTTRMVAQASRSLRPLAAVMLDLDHFKHINDSHGHERGDEVLTAVGAALHEAVRASDFVGRQGGEEFVILMPDTGADGAVAAAEKIRTAIAGLSIPGVDRPVTASLGIAVLPTHATDEATLLRSADRALYTAKRHGRNRVELATLSGATDGGWAPGEPPVSGVPA